ncbi:hypothetical protein FACS1894179_06300 [Bacteroidia bacterium]|nr:hypothetical protein FACS1894179_06300 [Bacteroidia bacterium]
MEKNFTEQDSLRLINEMINQARNNFQKGSTNSGIFCGYVVAATAFANFILIRTMEDPNRSFWIWLTMIPMMIISGIISRKHQRESTVRTHIDKIASSIWNAFAISIGILLISTYGTAYAINSSYLGILITPIILTMMGAAQYITSVACRFKPYLYGSFISWSGALACVVCYLLHAGAYQFIVLGICAILGLSIPGHIANKKAGENV